MSDLEMLIPWFIANRLSVYLIQNKALYWPDQFQKYEVVIAEDLTGLHRNLNFKPC